MEQQHETLPINLIGLDAGGLRTQLEHLGVPEKQSRMRANQLTRWMYGRGVPSAQAITVFNESLRTAIDGEAEFRRPRVITRQISTDGTRKWLLALDDGAQVEMVYIPETDRHTLCISSQVGCTLNCRFCHTGTQAWVRNLSVADIVGQVMCAQDELEAWPSAHLTWNIVFMGMGEPLYNTDNVAAAIECLADPEGLAISRRKITLSTAGVVPQIERVGADMRVNLAISLHATNDALRDELVPINRKWNIAALLDACREFPGSRNARRITFEYVMLAGVNDSPAEARALVRMLQGIPAKLNLIPFNPWPGSPYASSTPAAIEAFASIVRRGGYASPVRRPRGEDILAACGQLKSASERQRRFVASKAPKDTAPIA